MKIENYTEAPKKSLYNSGTLEDLITEISTNVTKEDLRRDSTVMSCISVLSGYIASMSLQLFKTREKDSIRINNDLTELLKRPNILYNYFDFIKEALQEMLINKEVFIKISTKKGQVIGLDIIKNATLFETSSSISLVE